MATKSVSSILLTGPTMDSSNVTTTAVSFAQFCGYWRASRSEIAFMSVSAWLLGLAQIPFLINLFLSLKLGRRVENDNPWDATTLEWATPTPPPHGNFEKPVVAHRGPYEYSVPGQPRDFIPQNQPD